MSISRRNLLAGGVVAFGFRDNTLVLLEKLSRDTPDPRDDDFWLEIRKKFDIDPDLIVFNHAGLSPSPQVVREAIAFQTKRANSDPSFHIWRRQDSELDPIRKRMAALVGCQENELALTMNATYGLQTGILGVPMSAGDEIVTTSHDYPRAFTAMAQRKRREGTTFVKVPITSPPETATKIASDILAAVSPKTKLVLLSQMTFVSGQIMPTRAVADGLKNKGVPFFVDGAHGIGLLPEKFPEMGADIYAACLHKWLMGPIGTGVFVVRQPWIRKIWPLHPADEDLDDSMRKFEQIGTRPAAPFLALKETLDFHEMIGIERKAARLEELRNRLAEKVLNVPDVIHLGSLNSDVCRAVLTVGFKKASALLLANWLFERHKIHVTTMVRAGVDGLRISPNVFTTNAEIDKLGEILVDVARNGMH